MTQKSVALLLERYDSRVHRGVAEYASRHRWHLDAHMANNTIIPYGWKGDGIITALDRRADLIKFVCNTKVPKVDVTISRPEIRIPRIIGDNELIGRMAAEHFLERGLRNFAWYSGKKGNVEHLRTNAFASILAEHGFKCISLAAATSRSGNNWLSMRESLGRMLADIPKPVGVFAFNDYDASSVIDACNAFRMAVPDDVAVLGVDNNELVCTCNSVPISSVNHDLERIGYRAALLLDRLMNGGKVPAGSILIPPRGITVRQSTDMMAINNQTLRKALMYLRNNYNRRFTVADVAADAGVSKRSLENLFRKELQRSIHEEILRIRLNHARDYLLNTKQRITDIAAMAGFCHPQHLNNSFREVYGLTPLKYRRKFSITEQV